MEIILLEKVSQYIMLTYLGTMITTLCKSGQQRGWVHYVLVLAADKKSKIMT